MKRLLLLCSLIITVLFLSCSPDEKADLVIKNAKIVTIDKDNPRSQAVAIKGEWIIAVGTDSDMDKYVDVGRTEVIDAAGRLVIPGFNDAHTHFGSLDPDYIDLRYITDPAVITQRVREKTSEAKPGELIRGGRWEHEMFYNKQWPTKEHIDAVSPNNPVVLSRADGHSILVNSYVLRNSGITKDTPDPYGGEIQKDPVTGNPTGILKESARRIITTGAVEVERTPEEERERLMRSWQAAFDMAKRLGVTTVQVVASSSLRSGYIDPTMYDKYREEGNLPVRIYFSGVLTDDGEALAEYGELREKYPLDDNWIRFNCLKGFIDGTLGSATMLVFEPFLDEPDKTGLPQMPYEELERKVIAADKMGFQVAVHAIGDKGNNWFLNACEKALEVNGRRDSRHRSEHAQILHPDDIPRFAELGVIASMQPTHCITDKRFAEKRIGYDRCKKGGYAWRSLLNAGVKIAFGTDYSVEPLDPMEGLYAAVTRKDRGGEPGEGWIPEQKLTMEEAIELYTLGAAYAEFMEDRKGMIKKGYLGDIVIINNDLFIISEDEIMGAKIDFTITGGKIVYKRDGAN
ncbi:amidohydrolase [candidate division KSB1 bacterium]